MSGTLLGAVATRRLGRGGLFLGRRDDVVGAVALVLGRAAATLGPPAVAVAPVRPRAGRTGRPVAPSNCLRAVLNTLARRRRLDVGDNASARRRRRTVPVGLDATYLPRPAQGRVPS